jgi:DNA-binding IclR family transcriptional regulator
MRATEIARALDLHPSSTDQLLKTMADSAYLLIDPLEKLYFPSPRLSRFAAWLSTGYFGADRLSRLIEALAAETEDIVTLAAPNGAWLQIVDVAEPPEYADLILKGSRVPILRSALGIAFLSAYSDHDVSQWLRRTPEARRLSDQDAKDLAASVQQARLSRFTCGVSDKTDMFSIAVPLPRATGTAQLVLGIAGPTSRIEPRTQMLVAKARDAINQHLSQKHSDPGPDHA